MFSPRGLYPLVTYARAGVFRFVALGADGEIQIDAEVDGLGVGSRANLKDDAVGLGAFGERMLGDETRRSFLKSDGEAFALGAPR